nr:hypothetical protein [Micromonospora sp. DSM 115978]
MGTVAYAAATSHVGAIIKNPLGGDDRSRALHDAWRRMDEAIGRADLTAMVVVGTDHYETFGLDNYPTFCLGLADRYEGWGEFGTPDGTFPGAPGVAQALLAGLVERGFDSARSHTMRLDHSFTVPLTKLPNAARAGVVPLFLNCNTPPLPSLRRCLELGRAIGAAVATLPADSRVGVLGTGGISHWVGLPRFGEINEEFDRDFVSCLRDGRLEPILALSDEEILETAGNGALEIRTWLVAAGATAGAGEPAPGALLAYAPMADWAIGAGIMEFVR